MESSEIEQRTTMKCCFKLGKPTTETYEMLVRLYGDVAVSRKAVYKWFERFRCGAESTEDEQNNAQIVSRLRQEIKTCRKSTKWFEKTED
jgi:hypothetical protein